MDASIIVPAYNAEKTIADCIGSLKHQTFKGNYEIIVVDDGSKDKTAEIAKGLGVRVISQRNAGPASARNNGAKNSKYGIIVFTDSDCIADRNFFAEISKPLDNKGISGVQGRYYSKQKSIIAKLTQLEIEARYDKMRKMKFIDSLAGYAAAYRKEDFMAVNGFDESFPKASGEDTDLSFRMSARGMKFVFNEKAFVWHRHPETLGKYLGTKYLRGFWRVKVYRKNPGKIADDSYTSKTMKMQVMAMGFAILFTIAGIIGSVFLFAAILFWAITFALVVPFAIYCMKKDFAAGCVSFAMQPIAALAIGIGIFMSTARGK